MLRSFNAENCLSIGQHCNVAIIEDIDQVTDNESLRTTQSY